MKYTVTSPSAYVPVTAAQMKVYLNIAAADTSKDTQLEAFVLAAKEYVQRYTKRWIGQNTIAEYYDETPEGEIFTLSTGLVASVSEVAYWVDSAWAVVGSSNYYVDTISGPGNGPARVQMLESYSPSGRDINLWRITYVAGHATATDVPAPLITVIKMLVAFWNENTTDQDITDLRFANAILTQYVLNR